MLSILRGIINKNSLPLKVLSIRFPLKCFLSILEILSIKIPLKVLSIKFPLKYFLLVLVSKIKCGSKPAGTFIRPDVALSLLAPSKTKCGPKPVGTVTPPTRHPKGCQARVSHFVTGTL